MAVYKAENQNTTSERTTMNSYYKIKIRLIAGAVVMAMTMVLNLAKDIGLINLTSKQAGSPKTSISIQTLFRYSQGIDLSERTGAQMSVTKINLLQGETCLILFADY